MNIISINIDDYTIWVNNYAIQYHTFSDHNIAVTEVLTESQIWTLISHENSTNSFSLSDDKFAFIKLSDPNLSIKEKSFIVDMNTFLSKSILSFREFKDRLTKNVDKLNWIDRLRLVNQLTLNLNKVHTNDNDQIVTLILYNIGIQFMLNLSSEDYK